MSEQYDQRHANFALLEAVYNRTHPRGWRWENLTSGERSEYVAAHWLTICAAANEALSVSS